MEVKHFEAFLIGKLKVKVNPDNKLFKNEIFPVIALGIGWVDCDVLHHDGTASFDLDEIELLIEE